MLHCCCLVAQLCPVLWDLMDCGQPGSSVHGISQARILEWVAISSSRESSNPGIESMSPAVPALAGGCFNTEPVGNLNIKFKSPQWVRHHYLPCLTDAVTVITRLMKFSKVKKLINDRLGIWTLGTQTLQFCLLSVLLHWFTWQLFCLLKR